MKALKPAANAEIEPTFAFGGIDDVDRAAQLANDAFDSYSHTSLPDGPSSLSASPTVSNHHAGTRPTRGTRNPLPVAQLEGEAAKSALQFRQFSTVIRQGRFRQATIDRVQPERQPRARMDHRMQKIALGPVAIG
jgi:alpha-ketoglutaric semialdehyde dehydrogenase